MSREKAASSTAPAEMAWLGGYLADTVGWNEYLVTGLNMAANFVLEFLFIRSSLRTHSPRAGMAYSPQWMNMPKRAWVYHAVRRS